VSRTRMSLAVTASSQTGPCAGPRTAFARSEAAALTSYEPPDGSGSRSGCPVMNLSGFRVSHVQALRAARVTALAGAQARRHDLTHRRAGRAARRRSAVGARLRRLTAGSAGDRRRADRPASGHVARVSAGQPEHHAGPRSCSCTRRRSPTASSVPRSCWGAGSARSRSARVRADACVDARTGRSDGRGPIFERSVRARVAARSPPPSVSWRPRHAASLRRCHK
jgi:hypothetical protein